MTCTLVNSSVLRPRNCFPPELLPAGVGRHDEEVVNRARVAGAERAADVAVRVQVRPGGHDRRPGGETVAQGRLLRVDAQQTAAETKLYVPPCTFTGASQSYHGVYAGGRSSVSIVSDRAFICKPPL